MRSHWLVLPFVLLCSAGPLWADSITLTTGEKVSGTIKEETDTEVTIDVPVSSSITDERVIQKSDISKIDKAQPDQLAYQQLIQMQPNEQLSYAPATYTQILASLQAFLSKYPNSTYAPQISALRDTFQEEKRRVDAGEIKYLGNWLTKPEAQRRQIQIQGQEVYGSMQQQAASGDLVGAMSTFAEIEQNYKTTRVYPQAVTLAQAVLVRLQQDLATRMAQVKADQAQLKQTIAFTAEPEKTALIQEAKANEDRAAAAVATALQGGAKWVPLIPGSQVSIETLQKTATSETQTLSSVPVAAMNASVAKVDQARAAISSNDYATAESLLTDAQTLWTENESARYWADRLKTLMATPTPTPIPKATPKPLATPRPRPSASASVQSTPQNVSIITPPTPTPEPDKPFYETVSGALPIAAGILIVAGLVGSRIQKKRKESVE